MAAQESGGNAGRQFKVFKRCVPLCRGGVFRRDVPGFGGVYQGDVGVKTSGDVALFVQAEALGRVPAGHPRHVVVTHAPARAFAHERGQQVFGATKTALGQPDVAKVVFGHLDFMAAAGVVAGHPIEFTGQERVPQKLNIFARANRRVDLGQVRGFAGDVEHQMANRHFAFEVDVREHVGHHHRGLHRFARA